MLAHRCQQLVGDHTGIDAEAALADRLLHLFHPGRIHNAYIVECFFDPLQQARSLAELDFVAPRGRDGALRSRLLSADHFLRARRRRRLDRTTTANLHNPPLLVFYILSVVFPAAVARAFWPGNGTAGLKL